MRKDLPKSWVETTLGEVAAQIVGGGTPSKNETSNFSGSIPFMTVKDMNVSRPTDTIDHITKKALQGSSAKLIPADTIVIATRMGLGKIVRPAVDVAINQDLKAIFPSAAIANDYLEKWFTSQAGYLETQGTGTTVKGLRLEFIRSIPLPLAPLNEQKRIVDRIERLFSDLDKGEALLLKVQKQLAAYRQSVLKAAVTGELTKDWRVKNKNKLESGETHLSRILASRRKKWQGKGKYQEPVSPDSLAFYELPKGWSWVSVTQILSEGLSNGRSVPDADKGFPVLRLTALKNGHIDVAERKTGAWTAKDAKPYLIKQGDFLVSRGNGSKHLVGRGGIVSVVPDAVAYPDTLIRIRPNLEFCQVKYLSYVWNSFFLRAQIESKAKTTAGIYKINQGDIEAFVLPLPCKGEQAEIAARLDDAFSTISALEEWCAVGLKRSARLRQSILKSAFAGKLVPQDPADEPANELLKRIQERGAKPKAKKTRPKNAKKRKTRKSKSGAA